MSTVSSEAPETDILANVLLVDDRPQNLQALDTILEPLKLNAVKVRSGREALKELLDTDFAVILLDVFMPDLDGFATAELIKERAKTRHIPIIFLTAASYQEELVSRGYTIGAVDYIAKPFHPEILRAKVGVFVELYRKNEQIRRQGELLRQKEKQERGRELADLRRLSEQRYQELAESMPQIVWTAAPDGRITYYNQRWYDYTGQPRDAKELDRDDWKRFVHLDDLADMERAWQLACEHRQTYEVSLRFRRAGDGAYRWHLVRALPVHGADGELSEWIGTNTDIDDRARAEQGLRFLADASKLLASSLDYQGTLAAVAELAVPAIADWCAIDLCEEGGVVRRAALAHGSPERIALARELAQRYPPPPEDFFGCGVPSAAEGTRIVASAPEAEVLRQARDEQHARLLRELRLESSIVAPLKVRDETIGALRLATVESGRRFGPVDLVSAESLARRIATTVDNARLYEVAQRERAAHEKASRAKDEFLAVLSHELRSPLNAVLGWTQMLRMGPTDQATLASALETIERNVRSLARLIGDILDVSRIIAGKLQLNLGPTHLGVVVHSALDSVRPAAQIKGVELVVRIDPSVEAIQADAERLQQVAWNLLTNAIKFTPSGGRIEVELARGEGLVTLVVRDNGIGIRPESLPHVFDRFRQEDSSLARTQGGVGLGLSIVRHLVELHGGRVRAESAGIGRGTTLTVELPCGAPVAPPSEPKAQSDAPRSLPGELDGLLVLVVEDIADSRTLLQAMLERSGARVRTAGSAAEALAALASEWPDVLISDIGLPGENGYDLIKKIRGREKGRGRRLPAVALTAYAAESDRRKAEVQGFQAHLAKPVERDKLVATLATLVQAARATPPRRSARR